VPGVLEQERPGAVGALGLARLEAGLPEQRRLLVAQRAGDRHAVQRPARLAVDLGRRADLGQHRARDADGLAQAVVPVHVDRFISMVRLALVTSVMC
jgi:hypothetical protein